MAWKTIDFLGITNLDRSLVTHLTRFLDVKETYIGYNIVNLVRTSLNEEIVSLGLPLPEAGFRLAEAVEIVEHKIRACTVHGKLPASIEEWQLTVVDKVNELLWDYVEILESSVTELFQQLSQIPLENWNTDLFQAVGEIKVLLIHHIEDASWSFKRLDKVFWDYKWAYEAQNGSHTVWMKKIFNRWNTFLDKELLENLEKSKKFLTFNFKNFSTRYREYLKLRIESERSAKKFEGYQIFNLLDQDVRDHIRSLYLLIKVWHLNNTSRALPRDLINKTLSNAIAFPKTYESINIYKRKIEQALFDQSRLFKAFPPETLFAEQGISLRQDVINGYTLEVHTLWTLISRYREYILLTDPNPYVRARWGFSEWTVGPEPVKAKQLMEVEFAMERLKRLLSLLLEAIEGGAGQVSKIRLIQGDVNRWLHEMSQPLISKPMMKVNAERVVETLQDVNELGTFDKTTVPFVGDTLSRALRADWKYHVLFDVSGFEEMYQVHREIVGESHDRQHLNRMNLFRRLIQQLNSWITARTINKHAYEIEDDMNNIKEGLQDFFSSVQKALARDDFTPEKASLQVREFSEMLLDYRFLFGKFFHELRENEPEEHSIRTRFLFVDQYLESVDTRIQEFLSRPQT